MKTKKNNKRNHSKNQLPYHISKKDAIKRLEPMADEVPIMKEVIQEVIQVLKTTDLSNVEIDMVWEAATNTLVISKEVYAISFLNFEVMLWITAELNNHPGCTAKII